MDPEQLKQILEHQTQLFQDLLGRVTAQRNAPAAGPAAALAAVPLGPNISVPQPSPLALEGDMEQNFEFFERSWKDYSKAIGMDNWPTTTNGQKVSFLMSVIGEPARRKYFNFELTEAQTADPAEALKAIREKVTAQRNVIVDRLDFFSAAQFPTETIDDYASRLKLLAKTAKLGNVEAELVTYKVVTANRWPSLRTKMLTITDITLAKAVDMCRAEEIAARRSHELAIPGGSDVHKISGPKQKNLRCKFCGANHEFTKGACPALGKKCHKCGQKNHFEKMCKVKHKRSSKSKRVKEIKESDSEEDSGSSQSDSSSDESDELEIGKIWDNSESGGSVHADLDLKFAKKWKSVKCELDTGANTSLIGVECLAKLTSEENPALLSSKYRLQSFGGNPINVLGQVKIPCRRNAKRYKLVLQVVEGAHRPLLSAKASRILGFVKFCKAVSFGKPDGSPHNLLNVYRVEAQRIVEKHGEIFNGLGKLAGPISLDVDDSIPPVIQPPRRVPIAMRDKLKKELESLEEQGIIVKETTHTDWVSNIVIVQKGNPDAPSIRICLDPIPLNKALKRPNLQFVTLDEILPELGKARVFSTVDAKKGFWHVVLDEASSKLTTFWTPFGRFRWIRLPFGIAPAPEIFQMRLQEVIQGLKGVECIADDLLVYGVGNTLEEALKDHNNCLERLLTRLKEHNVKLNRSKLKLCQTSVKFYGHVLTDEGIKPDESKIATIKNYPTPTNRKEVHRFIGMVNYLSRFLNNLSASLTNLRKLIVESVPWQWTQVEEEEFQRVKSLVADTGTLRYYNMQQPLTIECDASCFGLGVVVYQQDGVIGYASRTLTKTERNYAQIEKELLAILFACVRFDQLIVGNPMTTIKTDHKPLISLFRKPLLAAPRRLQHMLLNLQRYRLFIVFVSGKDNVVADALSRAPILEEEPADQYQKLNICRVSGELEEVRLSSYLSVSDSRLKEIESETKKDQTMQLIADYIQHGWPLSAGQVPDGARIYFGYRNELCTQDGLVFRGDRILVPHSLRRKLVERCHVSHNGVEATLKLARNNLFWPGMSTQIKDVVMQCAVCAKFAASQPNPPMLSHTIPIHPFQLVSMDVFLAEYRGAKRKFLVTVDHYSDFFEVDILKDLTPEAVIAACKTNFARHGKPQRVLSDNATNFVNQKMFEFARDWDFELVTSSPHHQQGNGKSEAAVKIAKRLLKKAEETGADFWYALLHWRNIPNKIGSSPAARLFSRATRCGIPSSTAKLLPRVVEAVPEAIEKNRKTNKHHYDKRTRELPELKTGSPVYVQLHPGTTKLWSAGKVLDRLSERSYLVDVEGAEYRRSLTHVKPRKEPITQLHRNSDAITPPTPQPSQHNSEAASLITGLDNSTNCQREKTVVAPPAAIEIPSSPSTVEVATGRTGNSTPAAATRVREPAQQSNAVTPKIRPKRETKIPARLRDYDMN